MKTNSKKWRLVLKVEICEIESIQGFIDKRLYSTPTFKIKVSKIKEILGQ